MVKTEIVNGRDFRIKQRIEQAKRIFESDTHNMDAFLEYVNALGEAFEFKQVVDLLEKQIKNKPTDPVLNFELGLVKIKLNHRVEAIHTFRRVLELVPPKSNLYRSAEFELWNLDPSFVPSWVK